MNIEAVKILYIYEKKNLLHPLIKNFKTVDIASFLNFQIGDLNSICKFLGHTYLTFVTVVENIYILKILLSFQKLM